MNGLIIVALIALALVLALEPGHRRRDALYVGLAGSSDVNDRDRARIRLDLLALAARAEPFAYKPLIVRARHDRIDHESPGQSLSS
jgi:hypothetical protein